MDSCSAGRVGVRVVYVGVPAGAGADGYVFHAVLAEYVGQGWHQQRLSGGIDDGLQRRLHRGDDPVRIIVSAQESVARQTMFARKTSRNQARSVDPGYGGKNRVVV